MLRIKGLTKLFKESAKPILNNIDLHINEGEYCILLGNNGCGKSTLIKTISGEYKCTFGQIFLNNKKIHTQSVCDRANLISSVSQDITKGTVEDMTLLENLCLSYMRGNKPSFNFYKNKLELILTHIKTLGLGLEKFLYQKMSTLSGGQRQTIATLMAIFPAPYLLLLDEHTSALDPKTKNQIMQYTANEIKKNNVTTLMITHNIDDAVKYGDRLIIMSSGTIVFDINSKQKQQITIQEILNILHINERYHD